jgi:putative multicomponent Na+:H+ antiporter subunit B
MDDSYLYAIVALLPLAALMLTIQVNPYHALVIRGILGAVAALVYAVLGAADVALTEALVGTMLAVTLHAVAVRSSMVMRVGVLKDNWLPGEEQSQGETQDRSLADSIADLRTVASKYHLRLEVFPYQDPQALRQAMLEKEVHVTCTEGSPGVSHNSPGWEDERQPCQTTTRIHRLYEIFQTELSSPRTNLAYVNPSEMTTSDDQEKHL